MGFDKLYPSTIKPLSQGAPLPAVCYVGTTPATNSHRVGRFPGEHSHAATRPDTTAEHEVAASSLNVCRRRSRSRGALGPNPRQFVGTAWMRFARSVGDIDANRRAPVALAPPEAVRSRRGERIAWPCAGSSTAIVCPVAPKDRAMRSSFRPRRGRKSSAACRLALH